MATFSQLLNAALQVKDETIDSANSAERVGGLLELLIKALVLPYDASRSYATNQYCIYNDALYRAIEACASGESPATASAKWKTGDGTLQLVTDRGATTTHTLEVGGLQSAFEVVENADGVMVATAIAPNSPKKKQQFITLDDFGKAIQDKLDWTKVTIESFTFDDGVIRIELADDTLPVFELDLNEQFLLKTEADEYLQDKFDELATLIDLAYVLQNGNVSTGPNEVEGTQRGATIKGLLTAKELIVTNAQIATRVDYLLGLDLRNNKVVKVSSAQAATYVADGETEPLPDNNAPIAPTYDTINATAGQYFAVDLDNFTDPDGDPITRYELTTGLPQGVTFNLTSLVAQGTIPVAGTYSFSFRGYDPRGAYATGTVTIVAVEPVGILSMSEPTYNSTTGALKINASSTDTTTAIEYRISGLRDWGTSPNFTVPEWQRNGTTFLLEVRQSSRTASRNFTTPSITNRPPRVVTPIPTQTLTVGQAYSYQVPLTAFVDDDNDPLAYSSAGNPPGTFSWNGRVLSGTPTMAGTYNVTISVTDGKGGSVSQLVQFVVNSATSSLQLTEPTYNSATGTLTINVSGGDGTQIQYAISDVAYQNSASFTIPGSKRGTNIMLYAKQSGAVASRAFFVPSVNPISNVQGIFYYANGADLGVPNSGGNQFVAIVKAQFNGLTTGSVPQVGIYFPGQQTYNSNLGTGIVWYPMETTSESGFTHRTQNDYLYWAITNAGVSSWGDVRYFIRAGVGQPIYQIYTRNPSVATNTGWIALTLTATDGNVSAAPTGSAPYQTNTAMLNLSAVNIANGTFALANAANPTAGSGRALKMLLDNNEWIDPSALSARRFPGGVPVKVELWEIDPNEPVWSWRGDDRSRGETLIQVI